MASCQLRPSLEINLDSTRVLFLGYGSDDTQIVSHLERMGFEVHHFQEKDEIPLDLSGFTLLVSFGYRHLLRPSQLSQINGPSINLHMSLLPWNRGAHPIFWSFMENTPLGVSIHEIDQSLDTGAIIVQQEIRLDPAVETFQSAYYKCKEVMETLFMKNIAQILDGSLDSVTQQGQGSYHRTSELPTNFGGWDRNILEEINRLRPKENPGPKLFAEDQL